MKWKSFTCRDQKWDLEGWEPSAGNHIWLLTNTAKDMEPSDLEGDGWGIQSPGAVPLRSVGPISATAGKEHSTCCSSVLIQTLPSGCVAAVELVKSEASERT